MSKKKRNSVVNSDSEQLNIDDNAKIGETFAQGRKHRRYALIVIAALLILISAVLLIGVAFSWFSPKPEADLTVIATDFATTTKYSISDSPYDLLTSNTKLDVSDLSRLKLRIDYTGQSSAYIRVQLFDSLKNVNGDLLPSVNLNYVLAQNWVQYGDYFYYKNPLTYTVTTERDENGNVVYDENGNAVTKIVTTEVNFVSRVTLDTGTTVQSDSYINLVSVVEAVQPDRFDEFFGVSYDEVFGTNETT